MIRISVRIRHFYSPKLSTLDEKWTALSVICAPLGTSSCGKTGSYQVRYLAFQCCVELSAMRFQNASESWLRACGHEYETIPISPTAPGKLASKLGKIIASIQSSFLFSRRSFNPKSKSVSIQLTGEDPGISFPSVGKKKTLFPFLCLGSKNL